MDQSSRENLSAEEVYDGKMEIMCLHGLTFAEANDDDDNEEENDKKESQERNFPHSFCS